MDVKLNNSRKGRTIVNIVVALAVCLFIFLCFISLVIKMATDRIRMESISMQPRSVAEKLAKNKRV
jgi:hypothetical protein